MTEWTDEQLTEENMPGLIKVFAQIARTGRWSNLCLEEGFLPVPVHFYSGIPDLKDLAARNIWDKKSMLTGIDFNLESQIAFLEQTGKTFGSECHWPANPTGNPADFFSENDCFSFGCAASTHTMIRHYKPKRVIEIGSGMSSRIIRHALLLNKTENPAAENHYLIIDPYPSPFIEQELPGKELFKSRVELINPEFFDQLKENDVLFIDSGHSVRIGGDVNFLYLNVLPRLAPGVIIHVHDIQLPYEYHKVYAINESFRQFWTEQYLLQAFLAFNTQFEILLAVYYLLLEHLDLFQRAFPYYNPQEHRLMGTSFWLRRKE